MNRIYNAITALCVVFCLLSVNNLHAQTIIDDLQSQTKASDGQIHIECAPSIIALIGKPNSQMIASGNNANFVERNGFRLVFMSKERLEATSKQSAIQSAFPELSTDVRYEAPNWRLLVGDFMTTEEANIVKQRFQKEFPKFGKEMYVVSDKIRLLIER